MCGRYAATKNPARLVQEFDAVDATDGHAPGPDHNVAPTKKVLAVVQRHPRDAEGTVLTDEPAVRTLRVMRWGLVPFWAKSASIGSKMINARSESAHEKPAFRRALAAKRCLLPADGWFEWRRNGKEKEPFFLTPRDSSTLVMAGLWESWRDPDGLPEDPPLITCSVLTTEAIGQVTDIHHRMPLMVARSDWADWLDPDRDEVGELLTRPMAELVDGLELRPVSSKVNNVRNNGADLVDRVEPAADLDDSALFELPPR